LFSIKTYLFLVIFENFGSLTIHWPYMECPCKTHFWGQHFPKHLEGNWIVNTQVSQNFLQNFIYLTLYNKLIIDIRLGKAIDIGCHMTKCDKVWQMTKIYIQTLGSHFFIICNHQKFLNWDSEFLAVTYFLILECSSCDSINIHNLTKIWYARDLIGRRVETNKAQWQQMPARGTKRKCSHIFNLEKWGKKRRRSGLGTDEQSTDEEREDVCHSLFSLRQHLQFYSGRLAYSGWEWIYQFKKFFNH